MRYQVFTVDAAGELDVLAVVDTEALADLLVEAMALAGLDYGWRQVLHVTDTWTLA